ncbi:MAG: hypothetical protein AAF581_18740, partial [Planctomycetota bacterium]
MFEEASLAPVLDFLPAWVQWLDLASAVALTAFAALLLAVAARPLLQAQSDVVVLVPVVVPQAQGGGSASVEYRAQVDPVVGSRRL